VAVVSQRYLIGVREYLWDAFNIIDSISLVLVAVTAVRILGKADSASTSQVAAAGTLLLWLRVIQYLNGFTATAAYVRMTMSVISDMGVFLLMMAILVVGNACVLVLLYPLALTSVDNEQQLQDTFGGPPVLLASQ
jgi:hypothetical protein